jgi:hypothetical protein
MESNYVLFLAIFNMYALYVSNFSVLEIHLYILKNILVLMLQYGVRPNIKKNVFTLV